MYQEPTAVSGYNQIPTAQVTTLNQVITGGVQTADPLAGYQAQMAVPATTAVDPLAALQMQGGVTQLADPLAGYQAQLAVPATTAVDPLAAYQMQGGVTQLADPLAGYQAQLAVPATAAVDPLAAYQVQGAVHTAAAVDPLAAYQMQGAVPVTTPVDPLAAYQMQGAVPATTAVDPLAAYQMQGAVPVSTPVDPLAAYQMQGVTPMQPAVLPSQHTPMVLPPQAPLAGVTPFPRAPVPGGVTQRFPANMPTGVPPSHYVRPPRMGQPPVVGGLYSNLKRPSFYPPGGRPPLVDPNAPRRNSYDAAMGRGRLGNFGYERSGYRPLNRAGVPGYDRYERPGAMDPRLGLQDRPGYGLERPGYDLDPRAGLDRGAYGAEKGRYGGGYYKAGYYGVGMGQRLRGAAPEGKALAPLPPASQPPTVPVGATPPRAPETSPFDKPVGELPPLDRPNP